MHHHIQGTLPSDTHYGKYKATGTPEPVFLRLVSWLLVRRQRGHGYRIADVHQESETLVPVIEHGLRHACTFEEQDIAPVPSVITPTC